MTPRDVHNEFRARVRAKRDKDHSGWLKARIEQANAPDERELLCFLLIGELQRTKQFVEAEAMLRSDIAKHPDHPYPLIALAEHYHYYTNDLRNAKITIGRAMVKARAAREFGYQCLGIQARLAIESKDWKLLDQTLREFVTYRHKTGNADVFPESDFLDRIPAKAVSPEAVAAYMRRRKYLSSIRYSTLTGRSTGRPASGPPVNSSR